MLYQHDPGETRLGERTPPPLPGDPADLLAEIEAHIHALRVAVARLRETLDADEPDDGPTIGAMLRFDPGERDTRGGPRS